MKCAGCGGHGIVLRMRTVGPGMVQRVQAPCGECGGTGRRIDPSMRCETCRGRKVRKQRKVLALRWLRVVGAEGVGWHERLELGRP